jgi:hypothetical protein
MRRFAPTLAGATVILMLSSCASSGRAPATIVVTPATGLRDGQSVHVAVAGFGDGEKVWLSQCPTASAVNPFGCGTGLPEMPFLVTDDKGDAVGSFTVAANSRATPDAPAQPCVPCVLAAVSGQGAGDPPSPTASAPLTVTPSQTARRPPSTGSTAP